IKIDVEGAEFNVLQGMHRLLVGADLVLFVELHPEKLSYFDSSTTHVINFLIEAGYTVFELTKQFTSGDIGQPLSKGSQINDNHVLYAYRKNRISYAAQA